MERTVASANNTQRINGEQNINSQLGFRQERNWFLSFVMAPFKDIDQRATEEFLKRRNPHHSR
jgi:hypothetical protein